MSKETTDRRKWTRIIDQLPPENQEVETKIDDHMGVRNEQTLKRVGRLWYAGDMYVYYTPTHWREKKKTL